MTKAAYTHARTHARTHTHRGKMTKRRGMRMAESNYLTKQCRKGHRQLTASPPFIERVKERKAKVRVYEQRYDTRGT